MPDFLSKFVHADGIRTHYLEAGKGYPLVLLHSGEFGGSAELSWERNIGALAERFHVYAPDWLGFGKTDKLFCFEDMWSRRERHIASFLKVMGIERAHFIGNSMGGTMLITAAARNEPPWPLDKIVVVAGGGNVPDNEARKILNTYDGTREHMQRIIDTMFVTPEIRADKDYLERRYQSSMIPGAWECTAAPRLRLPQRPPSVMRQSDYSKIQNPVLLVTGADDPMRPPGFGPDLQKQVPGSELCVMAHAGHCPHIEHSELFNRVVLDFLTR
jgi:2-hydroxymuconate-semialdehyde hydrolase